MERNEKTFGELVHFFKEYRNKTYRDIAKDADISVGYLKDICAGRRETVSLTIALKIMSSLKIPLSNLTRIHDGLQYRTTKRELA